jgi:hypothetical protein
MMNYDDPALDEVQHHVGRLPLNNAVVSLSKQSMVWMVLNPILRACKSCRVFIHAHYNPGGGLKSVQI